MNDLNEILRKGRIVDNRKSTNMKDVLKTIANDSESFKCAVGYFYLEGLVEIINSLKDLKEIKILMGYETTKPTKEELIKVFSEKFNQLEINERTKPAVKLFYQLVKEYKTLKVKVYFGDDKNSERLHSKAYIFIRNNSSESLIDRYKAGIIGSSNLTPSGLVGNTELNVIINDPIDLEYIESWFENLWSKGTEDFEKLKVADAISQAIEKSKFKAELENTFLYLEPRELFLILIKYLNADYLFEEFKKSNLLKFQYVDFIRVLNNFNSKGYRGCFLTSSVGLGKSYVASQVAKYFLNDGNKVLIIAPAGLVKSEDQWQRYLKEFNIFDNIKLVSMGDLQKNPNIFKYSFYSKDYGLIIVDEAHNYRNTDSYRTRNLKKIIDENGNAKVLFLTATPVNTSLDDLLNLVNLFHRKGKSLLFDKLIRELSDLVNVFKNKEYEELIKSEKEKLSALQEEIEKELFVKSTRETIKTSPDYIEELKSFAGVDIRNLPDPDVKEIKYELDSKYRDIVNGIVEFITGLSAAHLRLLDPEKGARLGGIFKWILYKRFESDISAYYLTLKRLSARSSAILTSIEKQSIKYLEDDEETEDLNINFEIDYKEKLSEIIEEIKAGKGKDHLKILDELKNDIELINREIEEIKPFLKNGSDILFKNDQKINQLNSIITYNKSKKLLIFTEYKDTLRAIKEHLKDSISPESIRYVDSSTDNKQLIIDKFNDKEDKLRILITTDTLAEGFNVSGADIVINFDIPYNPVRIIQRIGRATRLDAPKEIEVLNFRPDDEIDLELKLVEIMELRIRDIIRFIGVEYRIWFEAEKELLSARRQRDKKIYLAIIEKIRSNLREGNLSSLEIPVEYSKPTLVFLQKAIKAYDIKKEELGNVKIPTGKHYTLLKGSNGLAIIYKDTDCFNEEILLNKEVTPYGSRIDFENVFSSELKSFINFCEKSKKEELRTHYFNDSVDRTISDIIDYVDTKKLMELYPDISKLKSILDQVKDKCGSNTEKTLKKIKLEIKDKISNEKINRWVEELEISFTKISIQTKLPEKKESLFAIGFMTD